MVQIKFAIVLKTLLAFHPYERDLPETTDERVIRLTPYAIEITNYANTFPKGWGSYETAAFLLTLGKNETNFAKYVTEGCKTIPRRAAPCDMNNKGIVRARTPWQLHELACPEVWKEEPGSLEEMKAGIVCAARHFRGAYYFCDGKNPNGRIAGAFSGYRIRSECNWAPAYERSLEYTSILARLYQPCIGSGCEEG